MSAEDFEAAALKAREADASRHGTEPDRARARAHPAARLASGTVAGLLDLDREIGPERPAHARHLDLGVEVGGKTNVDAAADGGELHISLPFQTPDFDLHAAADRRSIHGPRHVLDAHAAAHGFRAQRPGDVADLEVAADGLDAVELVRDGARDL